ncbi:MAG: hypothetical protein OXC69_09975 [Candidatus Tectomicrobia bacterium]|nr:hypothetical protein [Candidatus Tectomicrobia bacterium]
MSQRYWFMWFLAVILAAMFSDFQGYEADAGTMAGGTAIALGGLDSFAKTVDKYAKGNLGKMVGMIIAMAGIAGMAFQKMAMGLTALGAGIAIAFVPNIIGTAFDTTAAAPPAAGSPFVPWAAGGGLLNTLAQVALAVLWPAAAVVKYVRDPVVWLALVLVAMARPSLFDVLLRTQAQSLRHARGRLLALWSMQRVG